MAERTALCGKSGGGLGRHFRSLWDPPGGAGTHAAWLYQLEAKPQPLVWTPGEEGLDFPAKHLPPSDITSEKGVTLSHSTAPIARGWYLVW